MQEIIYSPHKGSHYAGNFETSILSQKGNFFFVPYSDKKTAQQRRKNFGHSHWRARSRKTNPIDFDIKTKVCERNGSWGVKIWRVS